MHRERGLGFPVQHFGTRDYVSRNLGDNNEDDDQPDVGKDGRGGRYDEDGKVLDPPDLPVGNPRDADGGYGQQIEGGRANDGARAEFFRLKPVANDSNHRQKNLRGG